MSKISFACVLLKAAVFCLVTIACSDVRASPPGELRTEAPPPSVRADPKQVLREQSPPSEVSEGVSDAMRRGLAEDGSTFGYGWRNRLGLFYLGGIHRDAVDRIISEPVVRGETLFVDSPGGEIEAAITLAEWVIANELAVVVRDRCSSACAQYVFVASRRREVEPGAWLSCHGNNIAAAAMVRSRRGLTSSESALLERAEHLYAHGQIDVAFAYDCATAVELTCVVENDAAGAPDSQFWKWRSRFSEWIPDRDSLSRYGFDASQFPDSRAGIVSSSFQRAASSVAIRFGAPAPGALQTLASLPDC